MIERFELKGIFTLNVIDARTGDVLERYEDRNLIVNGGRTAVTRLIGGDVSNRSVTRIAFGTNGAAPAATDSAITGAFTKNLGTVSYPTISSVRWAWSLEASEANGTAIREFGLLTTGNVLFARKNREVINKNADIRLEGTWEITF